MKIKNGYDFAAWTAAAGDIRVACSLDRTFSYVDRELDCMRRHPRVALDDGSDAQEAIVLDLLLKDGDGTPIVGEVKVRNDKNPLFALIQAQPLRPTWSLQRSASASETCTG